MPTKPHHHRQTRQPERQRGDAPRSRIRAFRMEEPVDRADAAACGIDIAHAACAPTQNESLAARLARLLRDERRRAGSAGYDLLRHAGLVRRLRAMRGAAKAAPRDA